MNNSDIADRLLSLAQLLSAQKENSFKIKAYRRAAKTLRALPESVAELARSGADLTAISGIGKGIAAAIQEIVLNGTSRQLDELRAQVSPEVAALAEYPKLDPTRVLRIYKKLQISTIEELKAKLNSGELALSLGANMEQHVRQAITPSHEILLYEADATVAAIRDFLLSERSIKRIEPTGAFRRRVETVSELNFLIETTDFPTTLAKLARYGGSSTLITSTENSAMLQLPSGILLKLETPAPAKWGLAQIVHTGSEAHVQKLELLKLARSRAAYPTEDSVYRKLGLTFIPPELREGRDEIALAAQNKLPVLVTAQDIRGELHAHSTSSDGANTVEEMALAARTKGYEYTTITDHSQSLKIARGLSEPDLRKQLDYIDKLNGSKGAIRILKSAEVDILGDGSLDYPDDLLRELDYTVCSIHSKFNLNRQQQTERILRAMDNRYFTILGHPTGRRLLKRTGYEIDLERIIRHARQNNCFFEINSSPERLDLSSENARMVHAAGIKLAISTDAHSTREYEFIRCGIDQARRAGLPKDAILNTRSWPELKVLFRR